MGRKEAMIAEAIAIAEDDSHGYSQVRRWPDQGTDYDCSSLMLWCAAAAGYDVPTGWGNTETMVASLTAAGFAALPFDGNLGDLDPGDILVNVVNHTEMYIGDGMFVGAHGPEGDGVDGMPGDQTGGEISICPAYIYWDGWDFVLVPPDDGGEPQEPAPAQPPAGNQPTYNAYVDDEWLDTMVGLHDTGGSGDDYAGIIGLPIQFIAIEGVGKYRVATEDGGWLPWVGKRDLEDYDDGCAGDGSGVIALAIPDKAVKYRVHTFDSGWLPWMIGNKDTGGGFDTFAGDYSYIDAVQITCA